MTAIANNCLPSVVSITNRGVTEVRTMFGTYQQDAESSGSGIIIGENETELLIVTNYHVVSGSNELSVVFSYDEDSDDPSLVSARVKGYEADKDLAVIAVSLDDITDEMRSKIKIATIGDSSNLVLGQEVVAIGNALGYGQSVTTGIISALGRNVTVSDENGGSITNKLIQTDAAINPGNSGGALLNMNGELIGINSVKVSSSSVEGMGYAIPISDVQSIIEELMLKETRDVVAEEKQGYLGINPHRLDVSAKIERRCVGSLAVIEDGDNRLVLWWSLSPILRFLSQLIILISRTVHTMLAPHIALQQPFPDQMPFGRHS